jgi:hypothetical protein
MFKRTANNKERENFMDDLNQLAVSSEAFASRPGESDMSLSSHQRGKAAWHRTVLMLAAWIEIIVGASFIFALDAKFQLIFGAMPEGIGALFARFAGVALIGLGVACIPSKLERTSQNAVRGLFVFNIGATIFFAWVAIATTFRGAVLWPVVILHAVLSIALAFSLRREE